MDRQLLKILYETYYNEIFQYLFFLSQRKEIAEDLAQETFLKALLALPDHHTNMRAWIYMVARNLYYNYHRKEQKIAPLDENVKLSKESREPDKEIIQNERNRILMQALDKLEDRAREVLLLQYFGNLSQKEIAAILHLTPQNVRVLAFRAKKKVREYMEVNGYDVS